MRHGKNIVMHRRIIPPDSWLPGGPFQPVSSSSFPAPGAVRRTIGAPALPGAAVARPLDRWRIEFAALFPLGVEVFLIGGPTVAGIAPAPAFGPIPLSHRGYLDTIAPFAVDAAGRIIDVDPLIVGANIGWSVYVNNVLAAPYGAIDTILCPWGYINPRPALELNQGDLVTASATFNGPPGALSRIGIRLRGRSIPWNYRTGKPFVAL